MLSCRLHTASINTAHTQTTFSYGIRRAKCTADIGISGRKLCENAQKGRKKTENILKTFDGGGNVWYTVSNAQGKTQAAAGFMREILWKSE